MRPSLHSKILDAGIEKIPTRNGYGDALVELGKQDPRIIVLTADLAESTRVLPFQQQFPERFIECGVAEQNMVGVAAGLALSGKIPFVSSYATFMPGRAWDQIRVSVCYTGANVKLAGAHAGISVGPDGATHQALEDIAMMRPLPNLTLLVPCDYEETRKATLAAAAHPGPVYIRFAREKTACITTRETPFMIGKSLVVQEGKDITLIACGPLLHETILAAHFLSQKGIEADVINASTIKPFDKETLITSLRKTRRCVTVEEHQVTGGLFGAVAETAAQYFPVPIEPIGMPDSFGESGEPKELLEKYGMTTNAIMNVAERMVKHR